MGNAPLQVWTTRKRGSRKFDVGQDISGRESLPEIARSGAQSLPGLVRNECVTWSCFLDYRKPGTNKIRATARIHAKPFKAKTGSFSKTSTGPSCRPSCTLNT